MNFNLTEYQPIFNVAEFTARKYFNYYRSIFKANNYESEDLIQEAKKEVLETIKKYYHIYDFTRIFKLCNKKVGWRLKDLLNNCKKHLTVFHYDHSDNVIDERSEELLFPVSLDEERVASERMSNIRFKFEELHIILTEKEYEIIYDIFHSGTSYEKLGKKYGCSKQMIGKIYLQALDKVRNYLGIKIKV